METSTWLYESRVCFVKEMRIGLVIAFLERNYYLRDDAQSNAVK